MVFHKNLMIFICLSLLCLPALAQEQKQDTGKDIQINKNVRAIITDGITVVTLPGQNTNGEDLKCAVYEAFGGAGGAGGISCNWTPAYLEKRKK